MTALVATALVVLGLLDGAFSGFRASLGRTGLVNHRASDRAGLKRGAALLALLTTPAIFAFALDVMMLGQRTSDYVDAGLEFLAVISPYAAIVLMALTAYGVLGWKQKYLASALVLGPFTLARPYVAIGASVLAVLSVRDASVGVVAALAVGGVLLVEPVSNRHWHS